MKRQLLFFIISLFGFVIVSAQRISGTVTDAKTGELLPFVNVQLEGGGFTRTDVNGKYSLPFRAGKMRVSMIGYDTKTVRVGQAGVYNVKLQDNTSELREAVVTGHRKKYSRKNNPAVELMQKVIAKCVDAEVDVAAYDKNRLALYNGLKECGFECIKPQGAFYLFVKSPVADEKAFCEAGKKYNILMVPGSSFACPGYVRLAYCVSYDTIINSLPEFKKLAEEFGL